MDFEHDLEVLQESLSGTHSLFPQKKWPQDAWRAFHTIVANTRSYQSVLGMASRIQEDDVEEDTEEDWLPLSLQKK